jgi:myo-inositol-1(or 4)-monophosphatase
MTPDDLAVARLAAAAGARELARHYRPSGVRDTAVSKRERRNLVTDADLGAEAAVLEVLTQLRPHDVLVAEESRAEVLPGARQWFVDPLDGTNNFAQGIPIFCVSVALYEDGRPIVGVVHAPMLGEIYESGPDAPCSLNGARIAVSSTVELADAICATGFPYDRESTDDHNADNFTNVLFKVRGMRRCGSAALDLAWVAAGRLDGFWELWLQPWDVAAGAALVLAAGGRVTDVTGGNDWLTGRHVVATNGHLHTELRSALKRPGFARGSA